MEMAVRHWPDGSEEGDPALGSPDSANIQRVGPFAGEADACFTRPKHVHHAPGIPAAG